MLSGKQRRYLRALGHALQPLVHIGKDGLSPGFIAATVQALNDHELIKVKITDNAEVSREEAAAQLATATDSEVAQILGGTILLYKPNDEKPGIKMPGDSAK